ncbi:HU family DNA-binding protein [Acidobacteriota bacterium]
MIKKDLATRMSQRQNVSYQDAEKMVEDLLSILKEALKEGEEIELRGFGCFRIREQRSRPGRNPKTGEPALVPRRFIVKFKKSSCWEVWERYVK